MKRMRHAAVLLGCVALMGGMVACGDDDDDGGGGGSTSGGSGTATEGAKVIDPASMEGATGEITYCQGKDTAGNAKALIQEFNDKYQGQGLSAKLVEFPADAGEQRNQFVQRQEAKSGECDVFSSDVIWTAEFASQNWLYDMTPYVDSKKDTFIPAVLETVNYQDKYWGVPDTSDAAFLYYHTDKVKEVPATWQEVYSQAQQDGGIVYQGAAYEGLTCDFLEIAFAAGGSVLSEDGTESTFNSQQNIDALQFMVDGINDGAAPKAVATYMEEESRRAFENGKPRVHAQLAVRVLRRPEEQERAEVRGRAVPGVRGRRQGRHPRRAQQRDLGLLEEPGRRARVRRLLAEPGAPDQPRG